MSFLYYILIDYHTPARQGTSFQRMGGRNAKLPTSYIPQIQSPPHQQSPLATQQSLQQQQMPRPVAQSSVQESNQQTFEDLDKYYVGNQPQPTQQGLKYPVLNSQNISSSSSGHQQSMQHHPSQQMYSHHHHHQQQQLQSTPSHHQHTPHQQLQSNQGSPSHITTQGYQNLRVTSTPVTRTDVTSAMSRPYGVVYSQPVSGIASGVQRPAPVMSLSGHKMDGNSHNHAAIATSQSQEEQHSPNAVGIIREGQLDD